jgi:hypothetical protein
VQTSKITARSLKALGRKATAAAEKQVMRGLTLLKLCGLDRASKMDSLLPVIKIVSVRNFAYKSTIKSYLTA